MARIVSLDVLRGFALLGILLLNIVSFGLPFAAYLNPTVAGGATGANLTVWYLATIFWDGKMRAIFSMLFAASFDAFLASLPPVAGAETDLDRGGDSGAALAVEFRRFLDDARHAAAGR